MTRHVSSVPYDRPQSYYFNLSQTELLEEIKACVGAVGFSRNEMQREMRERLLPALLALKKLTYRKKPGYYDLLRSIGLVPDTVRQWFYRSDTADMSIKELEEEREPEAPIKRREIQSDTKELLLEHADRMAKAILEHRIPYAKKLATQFIESRETI